MWIIVFLVFLLSHPKVFIITFGLACITQCYISYLDYDLKKNYYIQITKTNTTVIDSLTALQGGVNDKKE